MLFKLFCCGNIVEKPPQNMSRNMSYAFLRLAPCIWFSQSLSIFEEIGWWSVWHSQFSRWTSYPGQSFTTIGRNMAFGRLELVSQSLTPLKSLETEQTKEMVFATCFSPLSSCSSGHLPQRSSRDSSAQLNEYWRRVLMKAKCDLEFLSHFEIAIPYLKYSETKNKVFVYKKHRNAIVCRRWGALGVLSEKSFVSSSKLLSLFAAYAAAGFDLGSIGNILESFELKPWQLDSAWLFSNAFFAKQV